MTQTKWDLIGQEDKDWMEKTPFGRPCSGCDVMLATEADFAKHFIVPNRRYKNLGYCPNNPPKDLSFYFS